MLRAFLAMRLSYLRATEIAVRVGQAVAVVLGLVGLFAGGTLLFVAFFVFWAAQAELATARRSELAGSPFIVDGEFWPHRPSQPASQTGSGIVWLDDDDIEHSGLVGIIRVRAKGGSQ